MNNNGSHVSRSTLVELLQQKSEQYPHKVIFIFLTDGEKTEVKITYSELEHRAKCIAVKLLQNCNSGDRALIIYEPGIDYIAAFFGCLYAGVIAVPIYPPRFNKSIGRVEKTYINSQAKVGLTNEQILTRILSAPDDLNILKSGVWITTDNLNEPDKEHWAYPEIDKDSLAFLQYTSGSTGDPKGVMISHNNLLENLKAINHGFGATPDDRGVIWLPPYHDMGLIGGILEPLYCGMPVVLISPVHFLQKPLRWLQALSAYHGTISGGPNFAYDLCTQRISDEQCRDLDLSNWRTAFNGAEMVRKQVLNNFYDKFKKCGFRKEAFYPCYGLAEATLFVTGGPQGCGAISRDLDSKALEENHVVTDLSADTVKKELVGCGATVKEQQLAIINPDTLSPCSPGQIGEICIKGDCIAKGYWNKPEETEKTFHMYLSGTNDGPYMRTGDLGFLLDDILYVTGRIKDMIIINGKNYYPTDIESSAAKSHPALKSTAIAAFSVDTGEQENLVIVGELERSYLKSDDFSEVIDKIKTTISNEYELSVHTIALIKTSSLDKTSSGKIQRFLCKKRFLDRSLDLIHEWHNEATNVPKPVRPVTSPGIAQPRPGNSSSKSRQDIENWLITRISQLTGFNAADIDPSLPFSNFGMDSVKVVSISGELEELLNIQLSPTILYNYPTIQSLSLYLTNEDQSQPNTDSAATIPDNTLAGEPIAIIGMACRFPGAEGLDEYWNLLCEGRDSVSKVPKSRFDIDKFFDPHKETPGKINSVWGGFLSNIDQFDPTFFGISPKEASFMDPQQRLLLETSWVALENAGKTMGEIKGSKTGVFIGCSQNEYGWYQFMDHAMINTYSATGSALGILANRISYILDLKGPSITLDTICSSSLISVHLACQSLRNQECNLALAGGVNLILTPNTSLGLSKLNLLADDGRCKVFDANADGIVRSEGVGIVVLKPLSKALAARDKIYAVIQSSAVNQDGKTNGITAPNGISQAELLREAYRKANIEPGKVHYIETHGTGTILGDPIEANAIGEVVSVNRKEDQPCYIGSVKTNLGHCESIGGLASLIKVALAIKNRTLPPNIHYQSPNPHIEFERGCLKIPQSLMSWPYDEPAVAGVSSFAFGGTNCHIVLREAEVSPGEAEDLNKSERIHLLPISAFDKTSLFEQVKSYLRFLEKKTDSDLDDIGYSAGVHKTHFERRLICLSDSKTDLMKKLNRFLKEETDDASFGVMCNRKTQKSVGKLTFIYPESDMICHNHALNLMMNEPAFSQKMNECEMIINKYQKNWSFKNIFTGEICAPGIDQSRRRNLTLFAVEVSLTSLWQSWGIHPSIVAGIGIGELAAIHAAGGLSLEDAIYKIIQFSEMSSGVINTAPIVIPAENGGGWNGINFQKASSSNELLDLMIKHEKYITLEIGNTPDFLYQLLGRLYVDGFEIDWRGFYGKGRRFVDLPEYCFHKNAYWIESKGKRITYDDIYNRLTNKPAGNTYSYTNLKSGVTWDGHPLVGHYLKPAFSSKTHIWELEISLDRFPYLTDHRVFGTVVVPSAFQLEMVLAVTEQIYGARYDSNVDLHIKLGIFVPDDKPVLVQLVLEESSIQNIVKYKIYSRDSGNWKGWALNAEGKIHHNSMSGPNPKKQYLLDRIQRRFPLKMTPEEYYGELTMRKMGWGPTFRGIKNLWYQNAEALGEIHLPELLNQEHSDYAIHPALLDAAFQVLMATIPKSVRSMIQDPYLLIKLDKFKLYKKCPSDFWSFASLRSLTEKGRFQGNVKLFDDTGELIAEAAGMILQRLGTDGSIIDRLESIDDVFYELHWQKGDIPNRYRASENEHPEKVSWLIFAANNPVCNGFLDLLKARGDDFITVYPGDFFEIMTNGSYKVRAADKRDLLQLMLNLSNEKHDSFNNVVQFWTTDSSIAGDISLSTIEKAGELGFLTITFFIQVLKEKTPDNLPLIWLISEGGISPVDGSPNVIQSHLWGLSRVISLEHPEIWGGIIDLDPTDNTGNQAEILLEAILQPQEERQLAIANNQFFVPRIVKSGIDQGEKLTFTCRPDCTYLITGGFGGLGFMVAKWLVEKGARFIVLTGRRRTDEYSSEIMEEIDRLKHNGIDIQVTRMDVSNRVQVMEVLSALKQSVHPLRGIIHTAGLLEDKLLMELAADSFNRAIAPKVLGSWNLHEETKDMELDFFVLFSSLVSFMGQPGQASYAAANTFMDFLAHYRKKLGLPALSINWGPWSEVGMAANLGEKGKAQYSAWGLNYISPPEGASMMELMMMQNISPQIATIKANWTQLIYNFASMQRPAIFSSLLSADYEEVLKQASSTKESVRDMEPKKRKEYVEFFIKKEIASILGYAETEIDMDLSLTQLGIDSLAALEFRNSIEKALGVILPLDVLFQNISANELTHKVIDALKK